MMRAEKSVCRRVRVERKEKVRKKFTTVLLACSMLLLSAAGGIMTGCETTGNGIEPGELPVYASDKKFEVGMWVGISDKIVQYDENGKKTGERPLTDAEFEARRRQYDFARPFTKESLLYREIFEKYYPGQAKMVVDFWMPNRAWEGCDVDDPSARVLSNYGASGQ